MIGQTIGHYEITAKLGQGGMGAVYRAQDTQLKRNVAIKLLPEMFANDEQRMGRFSREAQVLASLNHPNIASIYGLEESKGRQVLVMELVEGEDLSELIARGPIPLDKALPMALQIAEALESAHDKGIIHRDLKPANIKLTPEGKVKILDFGLAKALEDPGLNTQSGGLSQSPTLSMAATQAGIILGTAAYMSPEQARGKPVDKRADIWAFGVVLFEMLTGKQAFSGEDLSLTMANVMTKSPEWESLPESIPGVVRRLLNRCLRKDPNTRLRDIGEARVKILEYLDDPFKDQAPAISATHDSGSVWKRTLPWAVAGVLAMALVVTLLAVLVLTPQPVQRPLLRIPIELPASQRLAPTGRHVLALSPNGTHLVYSANGRLYLRALDQFEALPISGTEGGRSPFFSPDGEWVGFWATNELKKVSIRGGTPLTLCQAGNPTGATWAGKDRILFGQAPGGIFQVPAAGGTKELLVSEDSGISAGWPQLLPGGEAVLFTQSDNATDWDDAQIVVQKLGTTERKVLISAGTNGRYIPTGHLIYGRAGTLLAVPFDLEGLEVRGDPIPIIEVVSNKLTGAVQFSVSNLGRLVYLPVSSSTSEGNLLVWVDRDGAEEPLEAAPRPYGQPRLSPDGRLLALEVEGDIWIHDLARGTSTRVTFDGGSRPAWTPDGKRIVFTHPTGLFVVASDGSSEAQPLLENSQMTYHSNAVSPDGLTLLLHSHGRGTAEDALTLRLDGQGEPQSWLATPFSEVGTAFSPDGKWIVYVSTESGQREVYIRPFPGPGGKIKVSTHSGDQPVWAANGEIFYKQDDRMLAVAIQTAPELTVSSPQSLFEGQYEYGGAGPFPSFDATRDGSRFLMVKGFGQSGETRQKIALAENWFEELKRLVPTDR